MAALILVPADIANYIYTNNNSLPLNLQGIMIFDPSTSMRKELQRWLYALTQWRAGYNIVQEEIPAVDFANHWAPLLNLNDSFTAYLQNQSQGEQPSPVGVD